MCSKLISKNMLHWDRFSGPLLKNEAHKYSTGLFEIEIEISRFLSSEN
jgi:hypothetical protein